MKAIDFLEIQKQRKEKQYQEQEMQERKELSEQHGEEFLKKILAEFSSVFEFRFFAPKEHPLKKERDEYLDRQHQEHMASLTSYDIAVMERRAVEGESTLLKALRERVERDKQGITNIAIFPCLDTAASAEGFEH